MATVIVTQLNDDQISVNNKIVDRDSNGNWISRLEMSQNEHKAFQKHLRHQSEGCN